MSNTLFVGKVYLCFDELSSTNDHAAELIAKSKPVEGTVVRAVSQSAGRGQFGSRWESAPGANLTLSCIFYPSWLALADQFMLNIMVSLAVRDTVAGLLPAPAHTGEVTVKWPNDVYIGAGKTAGILIQNSLSGGKIQHTIVGIGLNVNQIHFLSDAPNPVSPALVANGIFDLGEVQQQLFVQLEQRYLQLKRGQLAALRQDYLTHLYRRGLSERYAEADGTMFEGILRDVTREGRLLIEAGGVIRAYDLKQVRFL